MGDARGARLGELERGFQTGFLGRGGYDGGVFRRHHVADGREQDLIVPDVEDPIREATGLLIGARGRREHDDHLKVVAFGQTPQDHLWNLVKTHRTHPAGSVGVEAVAQEGRKGAQVER